MSSLPAKDARKAKASLQLPDLVDALASLSVNRPAPKPVRPTSSPSGITVGRIESRIAEAIADPYAEVADANEDSVWSDLEDPIWRTTFDELVGNYDAAEEVPVVVQTETETRVHSRFRGKFRIFGTLAAAMTLIVGLVVGASAGTLPGDRLYGVKLKVEAIRLGAAGSSLARAELLNGFFAGRLDTLRSLNVSAPAVPVILTEIDAMSIESLQLIEAAKPGPRRLAAAKDLNGLARSEQNLVSDYLSGAPARTVRALHASLTVSSMVIASTERILRRTPEANGPLGEIAPSLDALPQVNDLAPAPNQDAPKATSNLNSTTSASPDGPNAGSGSASGGGNPTPTDTDPDCSVAAGSVCFRVPAVPSVPRPPL